MTWTQKAMLLIGCLLFLSWQQGSEYLSATVCEARQFAMDTCLVQALSGPTPAAVLISLVRECGVAGTAKTPGHGADNHYSRSLSL
jgi:hypothetical protein